jgi:hypothetical protein
MPEELTKESKRYKTFLSAPVIVTRESAEPDNLSPHTSSQGQDPESFIRSQFENKVPFTSKEVFSAKFNRTV